MAEYIDRQGFIEDIQREIINLSMDGMKGTRMPHDELYQFIERIKEQPAADVAPVVHAKWVFNGICTSCSACGSNKPTKAHDHKLASREVRFCYFCGAIMDLEESK